METFTLEVCCDSVESVLAAERGGASRVELCGNLVIGGTTPDVALYQEIRKHTNLRMHALLRPRFGDFCYTAYEFEILKKNVRMYRELGIEGVVIGCLTPEGRLDLKKMDALRQEAGDMWVTLHRAFDVCRDPFEALEDSRKLGIDCILTSGQKDSALEGAPLLQQLVEAAGAEGPEILVGSGVSPENIERLHRETGAIHYHMSGKKILDSRMQYRKADVHMGLKDMSEYEIFQTDEGQVRRAVEVLQQL